MDIINIDKKYHMNTYARYDLVIAKGKGATAYDESGVKYIDFTSGIGVNSLGFCDEGWVDAVCAQVNTVQHVSNLYYNNTTVKLAEKLCEMTGYSRVFFGNSGAEANECAIKLARKYSFDKYGEGRFKIITLLNSFHGRTMASLSATGQPAMHHSFFPFLEGFEYVEMGDIEALKNACNGACAVMFEPVQGEGGVIAVDKDYMKAIANFCKENDILFIADEVQTGIGRTGSLLAFEQFGVKPDAFTLAKGLGGGLPIGACVCNENLKDVLNTFSHGTTFGGNPVAAAGALYVLSQIEEMLSNIFEKGEYIVSEIKKMPAVTDVRGHGLMIAFDVDADILNTDVVKKGIENGVILLTAKQSVRLLPPLNITYDEIDEGLLILNNTLKEMKD